ncbi:hypothetical protein [Crateriforma conspicua]|uniref:hypothetical protein n=1 Tax=Crateriforma TaxID=2714592 RepID=UPI001E2B98C6|nr:hypothetical protein [Crateriforma conspicua]
MMLMFVFAVVAMVASLCHTSHGVGDVIAMSVDILKYPAYLFVLPLLVSSFARTSAVAFVPAVLFVGAVTSLLALFAQAEVGQVGIDTRLAFGMVKTFSAKHCMGIFAVASLVLSISRIHRARLLVLSFSALVCVVGSYFTGTRGFLLFLLVFAAVVSFPILLRSKGFVLSSMGFVVMIFFVSLFTFFGGGSFVNANLYERFLRDDFLTRRGRLWQGYARHLCDNPIDMLLGIPVNDPVREYIGLPAHNWFLGIVTHHGIIALVLLVVVVCGCLCRLLLLMRTSTTGLARVGAAIVIAAFSWGMVENTLFLNAGLLPMTAFGVLGVAWMKSDEILFRRDRDVREYADG